MLRLLLLRHAKTERESATGRDHDRALNERGLADADAIGTELTRRGLIPDLALVSTAKRALETWDIVSRQLPSLPLVRFEPELYGASPRHLLQSVHGVTEDSTSTLMIVAHNPGLHEFALGLVGDGKAAHLATLQEHMPTGAVAVIDFAIEDWDDVTFRSGYLVRMITPRALRDTPPSPARSA